MYFKRLELVGFKSFCDKTTLNFEPGITAVVGPNGCGKSNIFDSIRWVLGEQSAKSLRGSEMLDVIFNGTDNKEAVSMAEVTLAFDNSTKFFNVDSNEVAITRRLFRSGESEYLLNKAQVRLKDILDILLGTGIGAESYSIVAQGKIDLVLSSRPEDRRLVFDEASGITKYKAQKREATRKLEETEQNLLRVNDIVTEVKRQIASLERQANKARRYKEVFEELKLKEINQAILQKEDFLKQKDGVIAELRALETRESQLLEEIRLQEEKIANRQNELKALEEGMFAAKNRVLDLESSIVRDKEHSDFNCRMIADLASNREFLDKQLVQQLDKLAQDEDKFNALKKEFDSIKQDIDSRRAVLQEKEGAILKIGERIKGSLGKISGAKKAILDLAANISSLKNEVNDFVSKREIYLSRRKRLEIEKAKALEEKAIAGEQLNNVTFEVEGIRQVIEALNAKAAGIRARVEGENTALGKIVSEVAELEKERLTLASHKEFLEKFKTKYEDIGESMNATIYLDKMPAEKMSGLVIKVKDYCNLSDEDKSYFEPASFKLSGEAKPIELDTAKIETRLSRIEAELVALRVNKSGCEGRIEELNRESGTLAQELRNQEISLANKETSRATVLEQFNRVTEEEDVIVMELNDVDREVSAVSLNLEKLQSDLLRMESNQREVESSIQIEESSISVSAKEREEMLVGITQLKAELEALAKRELSESATLKLLGDTCVHDRESLGNIKGQLKDNEDKSKALETEIVVCQGRISEFTEEISAKQEQLKQAQEAYLQAQEGTEDVLVKIDSGRKEADGIKNKLYELQMKSKDIDYGYSTIKERMFQGYKVDLDEPVALPAQAIDCAQLAAEISELKRKVDSYGSVNLVAIEEYDELKKRYDFLVQQQDDLNGAKEQLHQAILKINRTTKEMFLDTFEKVRVEFKNYFRMLFNGGDAQVYLVDEQDPLESGIEIICRPPGKKLQNVLLLSGGEKSMSAIALIFAIFKVKPSPFCILDEIDAALDEANVDRFSRMLQDFAKQSQFIVITHNKKTIANASVMYGITMQESGVSRIVSVRFAEGQKQQADNEPQAVSA